MIFQFDVLRFSRERRGTSEMDRRLIIDLYLDWFAVLFLDVEELVVEFP